MAMDTSGEGRQTDRNAGEGAQASPGGNAFAPGNEAGGDGQLLREAQVWLRRLTSGSATQLDLQGFTRWRDQSEAHRAAFAEAKRVWKLMDPALEQVLVRAAAHEAARRPRNWQRRAFLCGLASAAGAAGLAVVNTPLLLSLDEWQADYRTRTGEQKRLVLAGDVPVALNTQTALSRRDEGGETVGFNLISGETVVDARKASRPFRVEAGVGRIQGVDARFQVSHLDGVSCVSCLEGLLQVDHPSGRSLLNARQQLSYDAGALRSVATVDPDEISAWQDGVLVFRQMPLARVIDEINRYRPGRVVLWATRLAGREVSGRFPVAELETALVQIERSYQLAARRLPGGLLILS
ncbi:DUF4880 domain-containing protein [Azoarcus indigens]|nr:FecR domain-containing protein [Azoarcus indigens]NMG64145.1 DUF4880 domain-containing protein [Azoarcus indigens]